MSPDYTLGCSPTEESYHCVSEFEKRLYKMARLRENGRCSSTFYCVIFSTSIFYFFVSFIYFVNVTCIFPLRFAWKIGFMIGLGFVLSLTANIYSMHHKENGRCFKQIVLHHIFHLHFYFFFLDLRRKWNEELAIGYRFLSYLHLMFWCLQLHGPFWTQRCVRASRCQYLPQTDTFIFPSLRFSLPVIRSEGWLPRNRHSFWQERIGLWRQSWRRKAERERTGACPSL